MKTSSVFAGAILFLGACAVANVATTRTTDAQSVGTSAATAVHAHPHAPLVAARELNFPDLPDGRTVLAVDLHTHSVFSDGHVWPTVRTWEAEKDALDALAITEHLEYQPHSADIPHPDRNRAYQIAVESAARMPDARLLIIPGAEITRGFPPGHVNAVFIEDANPLLTIQSRSEDNITNAREALTLARDQGAFVFWNHPAWPRDFPSGVLEVPAEQQALLDEGLIRGIEVANGQYLSEEALQVALDNELTILGTSDIHGLIDYDYDLAAGEHRTVTLVLAEERSPEATRNALMAGETVALYDRQIVGRPAQIEALLDGVLSLDVGDVRRGSTVRFVTVRNTAPIPFLLRNVGPRHFSNSSDVFVVPAHGEIELTLTDSPDPGAVVLDLEVLNALIAPRTHPTFQLAP